MTGSSSSVAEARRALGRRLREIRKESGLTARALAELSGWHESKCSRIENGRTIPSDADIRTYTLHCDAEDQTADLIAAAHAVEGMYVEWRRLQRAGLRHIQQSALPLYERARRFRAYESAVLPGLLQSAAYTRAILNIAALPSAGPVDTDDIDAAVALRMDRQRVLHSGGRRFVFLVEEWVLRTVIGDAETMAGALGHLISVAALPSVSLGIIPMGVPRGGGWPTESFLIFDDTLVKVELVSARLSVTQPSEVAEYARTFAELSAIAVRGAGARGLITAAIDALG
ncbi:helix-turn-helix transcriptional regulator [Streptomyces niveiscabiei]|uniref:helix-turn-helix domain-containing protein n=1 Tax=Streptomyces niveiscabiei TaxID=164115 RepID=UPI0029AA1A7D|nr:helix-turn-helix transcriptional regulator [Streptomyces niveiscabiei]MDX3386664.1 helix-turn-helix transcriptional regulator [Streptomyces niveiscabiei]